MAAAGPMPARRPHSSGAEEERQPGGAVLVPAARRPLTAPARRGALCERDRGHGSGVTLEVAVRSCVGCAPPVTFRPAERSGSGIAARRVPERWRRWGAMRLWAAVVVVVAALGVVAGQLPDLPPISDKAFIRDCVRSHNVFRRNVEPTASNMRYMTWDAALARTARAWANKCIFDHNTYLKVRYHCHPHFISVGENLWIGSHQIFDVKDAIKAWYNEVRSYNYSLQTCSKVCGHYTQVVWDDSYKLGCAVVFCKEVGGIKNAANFVCNYAPAGNFKRRPYEEGAPCSKCGRRDFCDRKLCRNAERDKIVYYSRWHPPWEFRIVCDEACIAIIISRASLIFVGFLATYLFRKHFTNMFMSM